MFEGSRLTAWGKAMLILDMMVQGCIALLLLNLTLLLAQYVEWSAYFE